MPVLLDKSYSYQKVSSFNVIKIYISLHYSVYNSITFCLFLIAKKFDFVHVLTFFNSMQAACNNVCMS